MKIDLIDLYEKIRNFIDYIAEEHFDGDYGFMGFVIGAAPFIIGIALFILVGIIMVIYLAGSVGGTLIVLVIVWVICAIVIANMKRRKKE